MNLNRFIVNFHLLKFNIPIKFKYLVSVYFKICIYENGNQVGFYNIKQKWCIIFFNNLFKDKRLFSKKYFNINKAIKKINLIKNEKLKNDAIIELYIFLEKNNKKYLLDKVNKLKSNPGFKILDSILGNTEDIPIDTLSKIFSLNKYLDDNKDILNLKFINLFDFKYILLDSKYNNFNFNVIYNKNAYYAKIMNNTLLLYSNDIKMKNNNPSIFIYLKEFNFIISKLINNKINIKFYNDKNYSDYFDIITNNDITIEDSLNSSNKLIYNIYRSLIYAQLYESTSIYSNKTHPIGKIKFSIQLLNNFYWDKEYSIYFSDGLNLKINLEFDDWGDIKTIIIPVYNLYQIFNIYFINEIIGFKDGINIYKFMDQHNLKEYIYNCSSCRIKITNYTNLLNCYTYPYLSIKYEGLKNKNNIKNYFKSLNFAFIRLIRLKFILDKEMNFFKYLWFFRYPAFSYILYFLNILLLYLFNVFKIIWINLTIIILLKYFYNKNNIIYNYLFTNFFKENAYFKKPNLKTNIMKLKEKSNKFYNLKDSTDKSTFDKIIKNDNYINKIPNILLKILSFMEKIKNILNFTNKKKSIFVYWFLHLLYFIFNWIELRFILIFILLFMVFNNRNYYEKNYKLCKFIFKKEINKCLKLRNIFNNNKFISNSKNNKIFSNFLKEKFGIVKDHNYWYNFNLKEEIINHLIYSTHEVIIKGKFYYNYKIKYIIYNFISNTKSDYNIYLNK